MVRIRTFLAIMLLLLTVLIAGCAENENAATVTSKDPVQKEQQQTLQGAQKNPLSINGTSQGKMILTVYNATKDGLYVMPEQHVVPANEQPAQTAMEILTAGTKNVDLVSVMPAGTKLRHISIKDRIAYVDFNDKLIKNNTGGSASERLLVAAIINTLTEFHDVEKVRIMVDGKNIDTISGHMDISEPLSRSEKIIKK